MSQEFRCLWDGLLSLAREQQLASALLQSLCRPLGPMLLLLLLTLGPYAVVADVAAAAPAAAAAAPASGFLPSSSHDHSLDWNIRLLKTVSHRQPLHI